MEEKAKMYVEEINELYILSNRKKINLFEDSLEVITNDENYYSELTNFYYIDSMQNYINHNEIYLYANIYEIELRKKNWKMFESSFRDKKTRENKIIVIFIEIKKIDI